jgi:hydrophobe/amphiphile efflux-1 (HAE1) family protein
MDEVSAPVVAVGLVLAAVFVPCAFISGIVGEFFRQFALTIAVSTVISAFNSLTLSPALAVLLLKPKDLETHEPLPRVAFPLLGAWVGWMFAAPMLVHRFEAWGFELTTTLSVFVAACSALGGIIVGWSLARPLNRFLGWFFRAFNAAFGAATNAYVRSVGWALRASALVLVVYVGLLYLTYEAFQRTPTGFIPAQDKGYLLVNVQLPDSASLGRTEEVMRRIEQVAGKTPGVKHTVGIAGQSILLGANAPNFGSMYVMLDDFHRRTGHELSGDVVAQQLRDDLEREIQGGLVNVFGAPPVDGLGTAGGFKLMIQDRGDVGLKALQTAGQKVVEAGAQSSVVQGLFTSFRADTPWLYLDIDRREAKTKGVSIEDLFNTLQVYFGSFYVNDFNRFGRTWQVNIQADAPFRDRIEDLKRLKVRNIVGEMVPLGSISSVRESSGPVMLVRYNLYPSASVQGAPASGYSSGQAITEMQRIAGEQLSSSMRYEWTELMLLQLDAGNTALVAFSLAVVLVFLVLAAQYESWSLPLAVILVVPMCLFCAVAAVRSVGMDINIFTQIGLVVLVGLACKNAILIVEFAQSRHEAGVSRYDAVLEACRLRLRPIMMTSFAFILGVVPLVVAEGAGAEMHRTLGTAVFGGMLGVTIFGVILTPVFFYVIQWLAELRGDRRVVAPSTGEAADDEE